MKSEIIIIRSETWLRADINQIQGILEDTIREFLAESDEIINIEKHTEDNGLSRFWIYVRSFS